MSEPTESLEFAPELENRIESDGEFVDGESSANADLNITEAHATREDLLEVVQEPQCIVTDDDEQIEKDVNPEQTVSMSVEDKLNEAGPCEAQTDSTIENLTVTEISSSTSEAEESVVANSAINRPHFPPGQTTLGVIPIVIGNVDIGKPNYPHSAGIRVITFDNIDDPDQLSPAMAKKLISERNILNRVHQNVSKPSAKQSRDVRNPIEKHPPVARTNILGRPKAPVSFPAVAASQSFKPPMKPPKKQQSTKSRQFQSKESRQTICRFCGMACGSLFNLQRHLHQEHASMKVHACSFCDKSYFSQKHLSGHLLRVHRY